MQSGTVIKRDEYFIVEVIDWNKGVCPNTFLGRYIRSCEPGYKGSVSRFLDKAFFTGWPLSHREPIEQSLTLYAQFTVPGSEHSKLNTWNEEEKCYMDTNKIIYNSDLLPSEEFQQKILKAFPDYSITFKCANDFPKRSVTSLN